MRIYEGNGSPPCPPSLHQLRPRRHNWPAATPLVLAVLAACTDGVTAPRHDTATTTVARWNALARELVIANRTAPPKASRVYAYLSVGQYASALAARGFRPGVLAATALLDPQLGDMEAAIAAASAQLLGVMFPDRKSVV